MNESVTEVFVEQLLASPGSAYNKITVFHNLSGQSPLVKEISFATYTLHRIVFDIIGVCQSHGQNGVQCIHNVIIVTKYCHARC